MCGRFSITTPPEALRGIFGYEEMPDFPPRYNITPTQPVPVITAEQGRRHFVLMRWGFVPSWAKEMPQSLLINARGESVAEKPSFRGAFRHHRALIPTDGFYEWQQDGAGGKGRGGRQPFFIRRRDRKPFAMATLWDNWMPADGSELYSCAIITTSANALLSPIHHRMPVILEEKDWARWYDPSASERELLPLLRPADEDMLEAIPVSTRINSAAHDDPTLQAPITPEEQAEEEKKPASSAKAKKPATDPRQMGLF